LGFTLLGSEWVLWLLIGLSVLSVAIMVERVIATSGGGSLDLDDLAKELGAFLRKGDVAGAKKFLSAKSTPETRVALAGVEETDRGVAAVSAAMASTKSRVRLDLERNLGVLGTLGNNAPFIGLFGTVLGIIKAFADLAKNQNSGGATVVMTGISEALVATAVGLLVAIPAVLAFNFFQGRVRRVLGRVDATAQAVLAALGGEAHPAKAVAKDKA
jgi:biopolymer transport protein ExbB